MAAQVDLAALRTALVVDVANMVLSCEHAGGDEQDAVGLLRSLRGGMRASDRAVACLARAPETGAELVGALAASGIEVRERLVNRHRDGTLGKTDCDAEIGFALAEAGAYADRIILCSGDADFAPAVRRLVEAGKRVWVVAFDAAASRALRHAATRFTVAEELLRSVAGRHVARRKSAA